MSTVDNKAIASRFFDEVINQRKLDVLDEIAHSNVKGHISDGVMSREEWKKILEMGLNAFADHHQTVHDWIVEGDKVVARWTVEGTHTGIYVGIPSTGRRMKATGIEIFRIENGKIVEEWCNLDFYGVVRQLGAVPGREELGKQSFS